MQWLSTKDTVFGYFLSCPELYSTILYVLPEQESWLSFIAKFHPWGHFISPFGDYRVTYKSEFTSSFEGNGNPIQYSCLENPMDRGAWWATVHGVTKSRTWLSDFTHFTYCTLSKTLVMNSYHPLGITRVNQSGWPSLFFCPSKRKRFFLLFKIIIGSSVPRTVLDM